MNVAEAKRAVVQAILAYGEAVRHRVHNPAAFPTAMAAADRYAALRALAKVKEYIAAGPCADPDVHRMPCIHGEGAGGFTGHRICQRALCEALEKEAADA